MTVTFNQTGFEGRSILRVERLSMVARGHMFGVVSANKYLVDISMCLHTKQCALTCLGMDD